MGIMKMPVFLVLTFSLVSAQAWGGTFTTADTLIPVAARATATDAGDSSDATTDKIHLDARVYIPDGVTTPAPVIVIIHPYGGSETSDTAVTLAHDFASQGYVVLTPIVWGFGYSGGLVSVVGPHEL